MGGRKQIGAMGAGKGSVMGAVPEIRGETFASFDGNTTYCVFK